MFQAEGSGGAKALGQGQGRMLEGQSGWSRTSRRKVIGSEVREGEIVIASRALMTTVGSLDFILSMKKSHCQILSRGVT